MPQKKVSMPTAGQLILNFPFFFIPLKAHPYLTNVVLVLVCVQINITMYKFMEEKSYFAWPVFKISRKHAYTG